MTAPYFYFPDDIPNPVEVTLDPESSRHILRVLRMKPGEEIRLADGKGKIMEGMILGEEKKNCVVKITQISTAVRPARRTTIAISLLKNTNRFEWFLEKSTELGITEIFPLICERTEKTHFRLERMRAILSSAMIQSQQAWMPLLFEPCLFGFALKEFNHDQKFIAYCDQKQNDPLTGQLNPLLFSSVILIGPEGDFSPYEIQAAVDHQYVPVSLGQARLRSETAGVVAATLLKLL
jgi:16S rRNA (uracil1498-N3)-methyltransferase